MNAPASLNPSEEKPCAPSARRHSAAVLGLTLAGALLGALSLLPAPPVLVWNLTPSVPPGLYRIERAIPQPHDLLVFRPSPDLAHALRESDVLPSGRLLIKPLAAASGDTVCRHGADILVNGRETARALVATGGGVRLPRWTGCRRLSPNEIFLLSHRPDSFDSRYFGPVGADGVLGIARPLLTFGPAPAGAAP